MWVANDLYSWLTGTLQPKARHMHLPTGSLDQGSLSKRTPAVSGLERFPLQHVPALSVFQDLMIRVHRTTLKPRLLPQQHISHTDMNIYKNQQSLKKKKSVLFWSLKIFPHELTADFSNIYPQLEHLLEGNILSVTGC